MEKMTMTTRKATIFEKLAGVIWRLNYMMIVKARPKLQRSKK